MSSRLPGARRRLFALILLAWAGPAAGDPGQAAFDARDFDAARDLWEAAADRGSAEALLGLGTLYDLGLSVPRDPEHALDLYRRAAEAGLPQAQFNTAVMLDSGAAGAIDLDAALAWYARAAANGHGRAQYALGLIYSGGTEVPANPRLAAVWLDRAVDAVPAAREVLEDLAPAAGGGVDAPTPLVGAVVGGADDYRAELAWTAPPAGDEARFYVEIAEPGRPGRILSEIDTAASAVTVPLPRAEGLSWRVSYTDPETSRYRSTDWLALGPEGVAAGPGQRLRLLTRDDDPGAVRLAEEIAAAFASGDVWAERAEAADGAAPATAVEFRWQDDADAARRIASYLPAPTEQMPDQPGPGLGAAPGVIDVIIVGGPSTALD